MLDCCLTLRRKYACVGEGGGVKKIQNGRERGQNMEDHVWCNYVCKHIVSTFEGRACEYDMRWGHVSIRGSRPMRWGHVDM